MQLTLYQLKIGMILSNFDELKLRKGTFYQLFKILLKFYHLIQIEVIVH